MKITFFRHSLLNRGGDKMIVVYASHLAASGHDVTIRTCYSNTVFCLHPNVRVEPLKSSTKLGTLLMAALQLQTADIVIADIIPLACLLALRNKNKVLYFAQDYDEAYYQSKLAKLFIRLLYWLGLGVLRIKAIAVARHLAESFHTRFGAGAIVVENGIDAGSFFPDPDPDLVAAKEQREVILILSRTDMRKGFDIAKLVMEQISSEISASCEIWTVGEPAVECFSSFRHRHFGYVDEARLRRIMSSADVFFYPTRHEGLPLMPLESMACACPVVTTTAVPYALHGVNALVAQIEDCTVLSQHLLALLRDRDLRVQLVEGGKRLADRASVSEAAQQFAMALEGMVQR